LDDLDAKLVAELAYDIADASAQFDRQNPVAVLRDSDGAV
jgi:hypothetical protein